MAPVHQTVIFYQSMIAVSFLVIILPKYVSNKKTTKTADKLPNVVMETYYQSFIQNVSAQLKDNIDVFLIKISQCSKIHSFAV